MTFFHILGAASLLIVVAVSTVVRAGLGAEYRAGITPDDAQLRVSVEWVEPCCAATWAEDSAVLMGRMPVPAAHGALRDRMRP